MSLPPILPSTAAAAFARVQGVARGGEASNDFHTLDGERGPDAGVRGETRRTTTASRLSRSGTVTGAPLWNGPALRPAFVAQVIGQVLMDQKPSVPSAYRQAVAQIAPGAFIDDAV